MGMSFWTRNRWCRATGLAGSLPLQPDWNEMVAKIAPGSERMTDACMLFGMPFSKCFLYRQMLALWAAAVPVRFALRLEGSLLQGHAMLGFTGHGIAHFCGVEV